MAHVSLLLAVLAAAPTETRSSSISAAPVASAGLSFDVGRFVLEVPLSLRARLEDVGDYPVDLAGHKLGGASFLPQLRVGARLDSKLRMVPFLILAEYEHDVITGYTHGRPELEGEGLPSSTKATHQLRKAYGRLSLGPYLHAGGGFMTSHWGLGLLANDGAHGYTPGSALFTDPSGGDRVLRGFLATGPVGTAKFFASVAYDQVQGDESLLPGDRARQLVAAMMVGRNQPEWLGVYLVRRWQDSASGERTRVTVLDLSAGAKVELDPGLNLSVETEAALINGVTQLGASPELPEKQVVQVGAALRAVVDAGGGGFALDVLYASGDGDIDDDTQRAFRADPNYPMGLVLYRHLLAGQTGRAAATAADPSLIGVPPSGLERYPSRGSPTNTLALFPRAFLRPRPGLEIYGGPLLAFSAAPLSDPLRSRVAGGAPRNALGGSGEGKYLGTELDLGVRWQLELWQSTLWLGAELGALIPGSAFEDASGGTLERIVAGRLLAEYRI